MSKSRSAAPWPCWTRLRSAAPTTAASPSSSCCGGVLLTAGPIKELSVVGAHGETLCTDRGNSIAPRNVVSSAPTANPNILLDVMRLGDERMLRVRRIAPSSKFALAALLPAELLLPQVAPDGTRFVGYARIALADDTIVGVVGSSMDTALREGVVGGRARSDRYGIAVTAAAARNGVFATYDNLRRVVMVVAGLLALIVLAAVLIVPRREGKDPYRDIERAIGAREFVPYYQPIVDIKSGAIVGAEVLVRWRKRDGSLVPPANFIPFLESTDLILDMTRSLMRQVGDEMGPLLEHRANMYVAFNIAPRHLTGDMLIDDIGSIFVGGPISTSQIVLEVTERYEIENLVETRDLIAALQGLGCRVAIDDVGTGHNGLSYILKLGVDIIKIDKMFVDAIRTEFSFTGDRRDAGGSRAQSADADRRRGRGGFRAGRLPARPRDQFGAGLCLCATASGAGFHPADRGARSGGTGSAANGDCRRILAAGGRVTPARCRVAAGAAKPPESPGHVVAFPP